MSLICEAIRTRRLLEFTYKSLPRVVAPYCHGRSARGAELLRAIQVRGQSSSRGARSGKLWRAAEMQDVRLLQERFEADDPHYNPKDSAMASIHCRI